MLSISFSITIASFPGLPRFLLFGLCSLGYLRENPSLISYGEPTLNIDSCTDPMRRVQLEEEAVSRYISTHHMDRSAWGTDFEIVTSQSPHNSDL